MQKVAGALLFLAGVVVIMGIVTGEIFYPGYSISNDMISTLGASPPPDSIILQPAAHIFDYAMILTGLLIIAGGFLLFKSTPKIVSVPVFLMGVGAFGVGIFPAWHVTLHPLVALVAFLFGGLAAITSAKITSSPFKYLAILLGLISLFSLALGLFLTSLVVPVLGRGGIERWVAYPALLWLIGFGGYLMNSRRLK